MLGFREENFLEKLLSEYHQRMAGKEPAFKTLSGVQ
jgi:hypothetical protein